MNKHISRLTFVIIASVSFLSLYFLIPEQAEAAYKSYLSDGYGEHCSGGTNNGGDAVLFNCSWIDGHTNYRPADGKLHTIFHVGFSKAGICKSRECSIDSEFECIEPGENYTTHIKDSLSKAELKNSNYKVGNAYYDRYLVTLTPVKVAQQAMAGYIKVRKKVILSGQAWAYGGIRLSSCDANNSGEINSGGSATITKKDCSGYTFQYWTNDTNGNNSNRIVVNGVSLTRNPLETNETWYAIYGKNPTLTLVAIDENGGGILNNSMDRKEVNYNGSGTVTRSNITGYTFLGIRETICNSRVNCGFDTVLNDPDSRQTSGTFSNITSNKTVYAVYRRNTFEAKMEVTDNNANNSNTKKVTTIDWTSDNNNSTRKYIKCTSTCPANFKHYLRQEEGIGGKNKYRISTKLNNNDASYIGGDTFKEITPGNTGMKLRDQNTTLNLGDTYYEKLEFYKYKEEEARSLTVAVIAPYNFNNTISISTEGDIVYAGETKDITSVINVGERNNDLVGESYSTSVPGAKTTLYVNYDNGESYIIEEDLGTISSANNNTSNGSRDNKINIKDLPAGTKLRVRACLYPSTSGGDENTNPANFGGETCSDEKEFTIAKRPSFQIWGGGLYSAGEVKTTPAIKNNLAGVSSYNIQNQDAGSNRYVFGSWVELGIVGDNAITGLASGASTGYMVTDDAKNVLNNINNSEISVGTVNPDNGSYLARSPLSFSNVYSNSSNNNGKVNYVGGLNMNSISSDVVSDKNGLISRISDIDNYEVEQHTENYSIPETYIERGTNKIIIAKDGETIKNIAISGNIGRQDSDSDKYSSFIDIPKLVIYANNINISCDVTRVDAILIAEGSINTCVDVENGETPDVDDAKRSKQLIIDGSIIAGTLKLNRTYGAATGNNSIIPAEIINYDTSIYLWGNKESSTKKTGKFTEAYTKELAPRY